MPTSQQISSEDDIKNAITKAITNSEYKWRTPRGVAREIGVPEEIAFHLLRTSGDYIRSRVPDKLGQPLFTTREKYRSNVKMIDRIISAITNKPE